MRIAGGLAAGAVVAGMMLPGAVAAPSARAATRVATGEAKAGSASAGVGSRLAELVNAATGADLWSRSSVVERPMGSITKVYGPGLTAFIAKMNTTAHKLGLAKTHFSDVSGLPGPGEYSTYSTAHDLIALSRAAMRNKTFAAIVGTREYKLAGGGSHRAHTWANLNPLLGKVPGATGIKTGYTSAAGQCLLFEAKRGTTTLIGVVLDSSVADSPTLAAAASDATAILASPT